MKPGTLYLIPVTLGGRIEESLSPHVLEITRQLDTFVVENEKTARQFLGEVKTIKPIRDLTLLTLNEHTTDKELPSLLAPVLAGKDVGLMSEAGCPGVADPGAKLVAMAHRKGVPVKPLIGPSSLLLSLMASGLDGQRFAFLGYLPTEKNQRIQKIREIEQKSRLQQETQIFIETPYRNQHLLQDVLISCRAETRLCIACNLTLSDELILTRSIAEWRNNALPDLHKRPTVFLLLG
ncbi:MAG TPA: SAM-dependent methyltransferase [Methylophilaceae bacterium]|nr:SAM-dependent methyltransferase [Methylophilaceae bacterium]